MTRDDRRRGRREKPSPSRVKSVALAHRLPVSSDIDAVRTSGAELGVVVAYGQIIPQAVFSVVPFINVHFSLLPRWRGAAPIERAILSGDTTTGVCLMAIEEGLDTGPIYSRREVEIGDEETADELRARLGAIGDEMLLELLARPGRLPDPEPQSGEASVATKVSIEERRLDFTHPAIVLARVVRIGGAWTTFRGRRLIVRRARPHPDVEIPGPPGAIADNFVRCAEGALELLEVQSEGRATLAFRAWAAGVRLVAGETLGEERS